MSNLSNPQARQWIYVSTPLLPVPDLQQWCESYTSHIPLDQSHQIPDFLTAIANIVFPPIHHPYLIGAYPAWPICTTCNVNQVEPCHPYLNARLVKSTPTCDSCSSILWPHSPHASHHHHKKPTKNKNKKKAQKDEEEAKKLRMLVEKFDKMSTRKEHHL